MDVLTSVLAEYGLPAVGWLIAVGLAVMLLTGKLKLESAVEDQRAELQNRITDRDERIDDEREDSARWQQAYETLRAARDADQEALHRAIESMRQLAVLMQRLHQALERFEKRNGDVRS